MRHDLSRPDQYWTQRNNPTLPGQACGPTREVGNMDIERVPELATWPKPQDDHLMRVCRSEVGYDVMVQLADRGVILRAFVGRKPANELAPAVAAVANHLLGREVCRWANGPFTPDDIVAEIRAGHPVGIGVHIHGLDHQLGVAGYDDERDEFNLMDPWGNPLTRYTDFNGNDIWVPRKYLEEIWPPGPYTRHMTRYRREGWS